MPSREKGAFGLHHSLHTRFLQVNADGIGRDGLVDELCTYLLFITPAKLSGIPMVFGGVCSAPQLGFCMERVVGVTVSTWTQP